MLGGIAPILIFNFKKLIPQISLSSIPLLADTINAIPLIPIPIYLDEQLTGIIVDSEDKNIDIRTDAETLPDGDTPKANQKGLNSSVTINMIGSSDSIGLSVLLALSDQVFEKVTSQEYSVTYINKAITVFNGLVDSFSVRQVAGSNQLSITLVISKVTGSSTVQKAAPTLLNKLSNSQVLQ